MHDDEIAPARSPAACTAHRQDAGRRDYGTFEPRDAIRDVWDQCGEALHIRSHSVATR